FSNSLLIAINPDHAWTPRIEDFGDAIHDGLQGRAIVLSRAGCTVSCDEGDFRSDLFDILDEGEPALFGEIVIYGSDSSPEDAVHGHTQRSSFSIHCAATADHQVREPDKVELVDDLVWDYDFALIDRILPLLSKEIRLFQIAREQNYANSRLLDQATHRGAKERFRFLVVVMRLSCRRAHRNHQVPSGQT